MTSNGTKKALSIPINCCVLFIFVIYCSFKIFSKK